MRPSDITNFIRLLCLLCIPFFFSSQVAAQTPHHICAFRAGGNLGWWYFDSNGSGAWEKGIDQALQFGIASDLPAVGDWNGDGQSDFGVFRVKGDFGWWYFDTNGNRQWDFGSDQMLQFGLADDIPVVGDWNGDGRSDFGVMRDGVWYLDGSGNRAWESGSDLVFPSLGCRVTSRSPGFGARQDSVRLALSMGLLAN